MLSMKKMFNPIMLCRKTASGHHPKQTLPWALVFFRWEITVIGAQAVVSD